MASVRDVVSRVRVVDTVRRARPRRDNRQRIDYDRSSCRDLQVDVLPASPAADDHLQVAQFVNRRCDSRGKSVHHVPSGLLQFAPDDLLQRLQCVQNAVARLVSGTRRRDHTPVLQELHWLSVRQCVCRVQADTVGVKGDPRSATIVSR